MYDEKETFWTEYSRWKNFIIWGNNDEYKRLAETRVEISHAM